jgi:hypothetical protein
MALTQILCLWALKLICAQSVPPLCRSDLWEATVLNGAWSQLVYRLNLCRLLKARGSPWNLPVDCKGGLRSPLLAQAARAGIAWQEDVRSAVALQAAYE